MQTDGDETEPVGSSKAEAKISMAVAAGAPKAPVKYSPELATEICSRIANGETLTAICKEKNMPHTVTVGDWVRKRYYGFKALYNEARLYFWERLADEILDISEDGSDDYKTVTRRGRDIAVPDHDHINRARLRVDTRKFILSKRLPKQFGDNVDDDDKQQSIAAGILDIIKMVANVARQLSAGRGDRRAHASRADNNIVPEDKK